MTRKPVVVYQRGHQILAYSGPAIYLVLMAMFLTLAGCGKKANPVPWTKLRPEAIDDLSYEVTADGITLTWSVPTRNHDGSPLPNIQEFRIYRAVEPVEGGCPECPPKYGDPIVIDFDDKPEPGQKVSYEDRTVEPDHFYIYQVRSLKNFMNLSDPSNKVIVAWHSPPLPPTALNTNADQGGIHLSWTPPPAYCDGTPLDQTISYRIWRRFDQDRFRPLPHLTQATNFTDRITRTYEQVFYRVTAVMDYLGTEIESDPSHTVSLRARDIQLRLEPARLIAFNTAEGTELVWDLLHRPEIQGYYVFRKDPNGTVVRLNQQPITGNGFTDNTLLPPGRYQYWVEAVDDSTPPNLTPYSERITVRKD